MKTGKFIFFTCFLLLAAVFLLVTPSNSAPEPALVPPAGSWQLKLELHGEPQLINISLPGEDQPKRFWYLLYTVTNNTDRSIDFYPQFVLFTDTFKLYPAGRGVRRPVFEAVQSLYGNSIPLLEPQDSITGPILLGRDNARDSVAIFQDFDPNANSINIFIAGLSNETISIDYPTQTEIESNEKNQVLLRKTLMLQYQVPGDRYSPLDRVMLYRSRKWIMR